MYEDDEARYRAAWRRAGVMLLIIVIAMIDIAIFFAHHMSAH